MITTVQHHDNTQQVVTDTVMLAIH